MSTAPLPSEDRGLTVVKRLLAPRLSNPAVQVLIALAFTGLVTLTLMPSRDAGPATITRDDVNTIAPRDITASHLFEFEAVSSDEVADVRAQAAATVLDVWDHDPRLGEQLAQEVERTFDTMRARLLSEAQTRIDALPSRTALALEGSGAEAGIGLDPNYEGPWQEDFAGQDRLVILEPDVRVATVRTAGGLSGLLPDDPDDAMAARIDVLARDGFSGDAERALLVVLDAITHRHIVADRAPLEAIGPEGIVLRTLGDATPVARTTRSFRDFFDLSEVDELVYAAAARIRNDMDEDLREALLELAVVLVPVNTWSNQELSRARREAAADRAEAEFRTEQRMMFQPGELLVGAGQEITPELYAVIEHMQQSRPESQSAGWTVGGLATIVVLLVFPLVLFASTSLRRFSHDAKDLAMMGAVLVLHLALTRVGLAMAAATESDSGLRVETMALLLPFAAGAMLVRLLTRAENALIYAVVFGLLTGLLFEQSATWVLIATVSGVVATAATGEAVSRSDLLRAGAMTGAVLMGMSVGTSLLVDANDPGTVLYGAGLAALSGLTSVAVVYALLPIVEGVFRYTTSMRLMELANLNHPALRELILKAPGTYHHSMMVGQLVEAGCEAVGANALLGRAGAYFHDIGKMKNPQYFAENQSGVNPHSKLKPNMSALVIKAHVKDGVEMARQYKLPREIIAFIREHHGTSLIAFFYRRAQEEQGDDVSEEHYRYPGPRPQTRETAICLLADGIEAASRALPDPTPAHLKGLIQKMINKAFIDGQFDECDLTLRDLHVIAQAFYKRLTAFYHHRPEYPSARRGMASGRLNAVDDSSETPPPPVEDDDDRGDGDGPSGGDSGDAPVVTEESGVHLRRLEM